MGHEYSYSRPATDTRTVPVSKATLHTNHTSTTALINRKWTPRKTRGRVCVFLFFSYIFMRTYISVRLCSRNRVSKRSFAYLATSGVPFLAHILQVGGGSPRGINIYEKNKHPGSGSSSRWGCLGDNLWGGNPGDAPVWQVHGERRVFPSASLTGPVTVPGSFLLTG